mgnify:FL=1
MTKVELVRQIRNGFTADRDSIGEAYVYACQVLQAEGASNTAIYTALGVLMNTIAREVENVRID